MGFGRHEKWLVRIPVAPHGRKRAQNRQPQNRIPLSRSAIGAGVEAVGQKVRKRGQMGVGSLSGGEKTRLSIALLLLENYNMLILDEPTTYLDVMSQRIILEAIKKYTGTLVIVSHTEDFIKELQPTKAILMPEQKIKNWDEEILEKVSYI